MAPGYTPEVDTVEEGTWHQILQEFDDANIYQTWSYVAVTYGRRNVSHLILKKSGAVAAIAQVRVAKLPFVNTGIAYIRWGPIWRRAATEPNVDTFRQAVRALRNEFVCKRGLALRLFPLLYDSAPSCFSAILAEEGFSLAANQPSARTMLMDLSAPLEQLREGTRPHWKRHLKTAERMGLEVVEGAEGELFEEFKGIYKEMVSRKKLMALNDISQLQSIQAGLPEKLKMKIMMCKSSDGICASLVYSAIGKTAVYLFGATSNAGLKTSASYLLHWRLVEKLKQDGIAVYNLHGIDPVTNPGTYRFKRDLAGKHGRDVYFLGRFDARPGLLSSLCLKCGDMLKKIYRKLREIPGIANGLKPWPNPAK